MIAIIFVIVGALNWGVLGITGRNVVAMLLGQTGARLVYILVGFAALYLAFRRDTYLPFLGKTVVPCSVLKEQVPEHADLEVPVHGLVPNSKVLYWASEAVAPRGASESLTGAPTGASEPTSETNLGKIKDWRQAYLNFDNAGVAVVDEGGHAILRIRSPQSYKVPIKGELPKHVHWRSCGENGFLGPVETTAI